MEGIDKTQNWNLGEHWHDPFKSIFLDLETANNINKFPR